PAKAVEAPVRAELKEFEKFREAKPGAVRHTILIVLVVALAAAAGYVLFFALPRVNSIDGASANIPGVIRIDIGGAGARVTVSEGFVVEPAPALSQLISLLREHGAITAAGCNG